MSKIGKKPITLSDKVSVRADDYERTVFVSGPLGELKVPMLDGVGVTIKDKEVFFTLEKKKKQSRSNWGTMRALVASAVSGVEKEFEKTLFLEGIGYRIEQKGSDLVLSLGFSHPVNYKAPEGIVFETIKGTTLKIKGIDKAVLGQTAAEIRALKKPEPYKGKGFRYSDEVIRRKAGKKAAGSTS